MIICKLLRSDSTSNLIMPQSHENGSKPKKWVAIWIKANRCGKKISHLQTFAENAESLFCFEA